MATSAASYVEARLKGAIDLSPAIDLICASGIERSKLIAALIEAVDMARRLHTNLKGEESTLALARAVLGCIDSVEDFARDFYEESVALNGADTSNWEYPAALIVMAEIEPVLERLRAAAEYCELVAANRHAVLGANRETGSGPQQQDAAATRFAVGTLAFRIKRLDPAGQPHNKLVGNIAETLFGDVWCVKRIEAARAARAAAQSKADATVPNAEE
jgi:hypothetical protein